MRRSVVARVVARVVVTLAVMAGALVAGCQVDKESEEGKILNRINQECTDRLSDKEGDAAVYACDAAVDDAYKKFGDDFQMKWHEDRDVWTFPGIK